MNRKAAPVLIRLIALVLLMGAAAALTFGYLGRLHPAFDSFSHFRIHLAVGLLLYAPLLFLLRFRPEAMFAVVLGLMTIVQTTGVPFSSGSLPVNAAPTEEARGSGVYRLLHMNLRFDNETPEAAFSLIGELRPDIITLNEVSDLWKSRLPVLAAAYPYSLICERKAYIGGVAILSRRPFDSGAAAYCGDDGAFGHATVDIGGRTLEVASLHMGWPWPFEQPWQLPRVKPLLGEVGTTAIVAGDFNSVPWSQTARQIEDASHARLLRGIGPTWLDRRMPDWLRPRIGLPLDNMMVKGGVVPVSVQTVGNSGSDHLPVMLEFMLLPQERPMPVNHTVAVATAK